MEQKWILLDDHPDEDVRRLATELNMPPVLVKVLFNRGVRSYDEAKRFFRPELSSLNDPFDLPQMDVAASRLLEAVRKRERVLIYGDYDVDGITSVALLYRFLRKLGVPADFYVPDRIAEGYGLSEQGVREAVSRGAQLLITVDCGVTAHKEVALARQLGLDVIVTDHHEPGDELPQANAVIDPKRKDSTYPFKELAGVGVAFKLLQALVHLTRSSTDDLHEGLDLVAIGTAADIVPLVDENRTLVKMGLERLSRTPNVGLRALLEVAGLARKEITTGHIVFILAPRINSVGRLGSAERAVHLLITSNAQQARNIASILDSENRQRKSIDEQTFREAVQIVEEDFDPATTRSLVLALEGWHPGVIGIVASRLVERFYRPTVMISLDGGVGKGSARSIPGFDLYDALKQCSDLMIDFGGHRYAAGLSIAQENIPEFRRRFNEIAAAKLTEDQLVPKLRIDAELDLDQIDGRFYTLLKLFGPFGPQNMRPVFVSRNLEVVGAPTVVGTNHLKFRVRQRSRVFEAIGFNLGDMIYRIEPGRKNLDLAYVIDENHYMGVTTLQLRVKDLR